MKFFTDHTVDVSRYCLCNIKNYWDKRRYKKKLVFIDPGVYELTKQDDYTFKYKLHRMLEHGLPENHYVSIDYPGDMNPLLSEKFLMHSIENNWRYKDNSQYICTIQYKDRDINSFISEANRLKQIWLNCPKIIGIGNLCRIMYPTPFTDAVSEWILNNIGGGRWIHVYGMPMRLMRKYIPKWEDAGITISVDSTKWTRPVRGRGKPSCNKQNREQYFLEYIDVMNEFTHVDY